MKLGTLLRHNWLYLLILALPFERIPSYSWLLLGRSVTVRLSYILAIGLILVLGWPTIRALRWRWSSPFTWLAVYLALTALSGTYAISHTRWLEAWIATFIVISTSIIIARYLPRFSLTMLYRVLTIVSVAVCLFGLYQFIGDSLGLSTQFTGLRSIYTHQVFGFPRIQSTELEPLYFANFLLIPVLLTVSLLYHGQIRGKGYYLILWLYATTLALTLSRGGMIAAVIAGLLLIAATYRSNRWVAGLKLLGTIVAGGLAAIGFIIASTLISNNPHKTSVATSVSTYAQQTIRLTSNASSPDSDRAVNRQLAEQDFKDDPLLGYGLGNFGYFAEAHYAAYDNTNGSVIVNDEYLEVLAETGIVGALVLIALAVTVGRSVHLTLRQPKLDQLERAWIYGLTAIVIAFAIQYYAFSTLYIMQIWVTVGLLLGLSAQSFWRKPLPQAA